MPEVSDLVEANRLIDYLTRFEDLMAALALAFIDASAETLDSEIDNALRQIADFADVRRSYLFLVDAQANTIHSAYVWGDRDFRREWSENLERLSWLTTPLQNGQPITINAAELSAKARENFGLKAEDTLMAAPLLAHDGIIGFIGMDWTARESNLFDGKLLAQTGAFITGALERQRSEQTRRDELKLLHTLIDNVPDLLYAKDSDSRFLLANYAQARAAGAESPEAMIGKSDAEFFPDEHASKYLADEQAVFKGEMMDIEEYSMHADGSKNWLHVTKIPYYDDQGNIVGLVGIGRDITERKRLEETMKTNERLMRTVIDNTPALVFVKDIESRFILGNKAIVQQLNLQEEQELLGKSDMDFHPPHLAAKYLADEAALMEAGEAMMNYEEESMQHDTGKNVWYSGNKIPLRDDAGKVVGLVGINYDITERKRMADEIKNKERLLRMVIDNLPALVFVKDAESRFILANKAILEQMNITSEETLLGKSDADFHPQESAAQYRIDELEIMNSGQPKLHYEELALNKSFGTMRWLSSNKLPLRDDNGKVIGIVGINHDITERKLAENALREMAQELEKRVEERTAELQTAHEQFAELQEQIIQAQRQAIHELSTPVIPILEQVIVMPLVGIVDSMRARDITRTLLAAISLHRAKVVILDITGVAIVDTEVANHLNKTIQAARLKGASTIVTGISDAVAETIVDLGIDWTALDTLRDLRGGLRVALERMGYQWVKKG